MPCVWNLKPEERYCLFCTAENCDERNQRVPPCGKCTHLLESKISDLCSTLECDLPNGNRKASRDVGGCEHFTHMQKGEAS